jgi:alkanesulfonate monooxygenase SsuD/methylene tetrahydromethanopterin reductase-like flavin-dependent oxidoreductase (luciferase family)
MRTTIPRCPQGRPVLMQAGSSPRGRDFAARRAEAILCSSGSKKDAIEFYTDIQGANGSVRPRAG